jgi:eukaryotic-like serine/threonine-protein kinase
MPTTFEPGASLSHYRVIAPIGAGGMGEVYKAHDLTLERTIALKILPPELVRNDERVRRFVQEAKSASSLNHPNIVTIHEIGQAEISTSGDEDGRPIHYIAMELIDGTTLRDRIHGGDTDLRTLLVYLAQAADGLAKAHGAGIIHRDLKPENIMITRDGYAKVLDFGLAKLSVKKSADATSDPTALRDDTREGVLLGTVAYMSPEQVKARAVDHRSDVFSFGSILYEAATRRRPFEADSDLDVMHRIVHDKPVPVDEINPAVPAELRRMIRRCLAKDPDRRYQSMKDLSIELSEIVDEFDELSASASSRSISGSVSGEALPQPVRRRVWLSIGAMALLALAAVVFAAYQWRERQLPPAPATAFASMKLTPLTSTGNVIDAAISPDGRYVAQVLRDPAGMWSISVRQVATASDVQIVAPSLTPVRFPTFSPDGNYVLYFHRELESGTGYASLFQVPTLGGQPRKIIFDVDTAVTFSPDRTQLAFGRGYLADGQNALVVANADGSGERVLARQQRFGPLRAPSWSPEGDSILWPTFTVDERAIMELALFDTTSGESRVIGSPWLWINDAKWLPDGRGIVLIGGRSDPERSQIWLQPYPAGALQRVTNDLNTYTDLSLTADGSAMVVLREEQNNELMIADPGDESGGTPLSPRMAGQIPQTLSISGSGPVVYAFAHDGGSDVAIIDAPGRAPTILTRNGQSHGASISSEGNTIAYFSWREDNLPHIYLMDADGSNQRQITHGSGEYAPALTPDGSAVFYKSIDDSVWKLSLAGGQPQKVIDRAGIFAVDTTRIAYVYMDTDGNRTVSRLAVAGLDGVRRIHDLPLSGRGGTLRWTPDGNALSFTQITGGVEQVVRQPLDGSAHTVLTRFKSGAISAFDWMPDGRLVMSRGERRSDAVLITDFR